MASLIANLIFNIIFFSIQYLFSTIHVIKKKKNNNKNTHITQLVQVNHTNTFPQRKKNLFHSRPRTSQLWQYGIRTMVSRRGVLCLKFLPDQARPSGNSGASESQGHWLYDRWATDWFWKFLVCIFLSWHTTKSSNVGAYSHTSIFFTLGSHKTLEWLEQREWFSSQV